MFVYSVHPILFIKKWTEMPFGMAFLSAVTPCQSSFSKGVRQPWENRRATKPLS